MSKKATAPLGKGKGKLLDEVKEVGYREPLEQEAGTSAKIKFPGAIKKNKHVLAIWRDNKTWQLAKILEIRKSNGDTSKSVYEYYVTYLEHERRNDRWVPEVCLRIDEEKVNLEINKLDEEKRKAEEEAQQFRFMQNDVHHGMQPHIIQEFYESTKIKSVEWICLGDAVIEAWYYSPFPKEFHGKILFICPFCLYFFKQQVELEQHSLRCRVRCPPGDEIYRDDKVSMFEFDAKQQKVYTENLGYIARLFLDHKNLAVEIDAFYFYILCERKEDGYYIVGYFSKEKDSSENNLSCIMVLPNVQRAGYGKFLIDFSYQLSILEGKTGSPEKPLSDLGHKTYVSYWTHKVLNLLLQNKNNQISIAEISNQTSITALDIQYVLESYEILRCNNGKYYFFTEPEYLKKIVAKSGHPGRPVQRELIHWVPQIPPRAI